MASPALKMSIISRRGWLHKPLEIDFQGQICYPNLQTSFLATKVATDLLPVPKNLIFTTSANALCSSRSSSNKLRTRALASLLHWITQASSTGPSLLFDYFSHEHSKWNERISWDHHQWRVLMLSVFSSSIYYLTLTDECYSEISLQRQWCFMEQSKRRPGLVGKRRQRCRQDRSASLRSTDPEYAVAFTDQDCRLRDR